MVSSSHYSALPDLMIGSTHPSARESEAVSPWCIETIDPLVGDDWDRAVVSAGSSTVFHSSAWAKVLSRTYGHVPHYLLIRSDERPLALVPIMELLSRWTGRRGVCLPFADSCGPLWMAHDKASTVYDALAAYAGFYHWAHLEIRDGRVPPPIDAASTVYQTHEVDLRPGVESLWQRLAPAVRRAIRKAERSPLEVVVETGEKAIRAYYALHSRTRKRHGLPPQPLEFFLNLNRELIEPGNGIIILAKMGRNDAAGAIFLHGENEAIYKFGASDERHWALRPNQLVMWSGMKHLANNTNCTTLNFGRTAIANKGLNRFKSSLGAVMAPLRYHRYRRASAWRGGNLPGAENFFGVFRACPLLLNGIAGANIYPHLD